MRSIHPYICYVKSCQADRYSVPGEMETDEAAADDAFTTIAKNGKPAAKPKAKPNRRRDAKPSKPLSQMPSYFN